MIIENILRDRAEFFAEIREQTNLVQKNRMMLQVSVFSLAIYGIVMGFSHSIPQALSSLLKLPMLFMLTLAICTPPLHFFSLFFGSRRTLGQTVALVLTAITATSLLLMSFAPITLFFLLTTNGYVFLKLMNVTFFAVSGIMGVLLLHQGMSIMEEIDEKEGAQARRLIFILWVILYGFVGSQMSWSLSPIIGDPQQPFMMFRQVGGNFYIDVLTSLQTILGL